MELIGSGKAKGHMALRMGQPPSAGTWIFFERAFQAAAKDPGRFNPTDPFEEFSRLDNPVQFRLISARYYLIILGVYLCFMVIWSTVAATLAAGRGMWLLAGLITAVVGVSLFYYLRFRHRRNKRRAFSAGSLEALSPLVKQAQRGTFNGFDAYPYARMYAEATYRRQQMGRDLENALPFEVQICHDIGVLPRGKAFVRRAHENEVRAVDPIIFSGLDFSTERKQERNRFLGSLLEQAQKEDSLRVGEIISTRGGVVVADIKWWNGTLSLTRDGTIVDANLGSEELSRHRSICALVDAARLVNGGEIEFVLVIVGGGNVKGGKLETRIKKQRVIVAEWTEAMGELIHLDARKTVVPPVTIDEILARTPVAGAAQ